MAENNNNIELIESGTGRFVTSAFASVKVGLGFGLRHTGNGMVWLGRKVQDTGVSLQVSAVKDKFAANVSSILANENIGQSDAEKKIEELTKASLEKINHITEGVGEAIEKFNTGKMESLKSVEQVKSQIRAAQTSAFDLINQIINDEPAGEAEPETETEVIIETVEQEPAPKKAKAAPKAQPKQTNRNFDEEAFADC